MHLPSEDAPLSATSVLVGQSPPVHDRLGSQIKIE